MRVVGEVSWAGVRRAVARWWHGVTEGPPVRRVPVRSRPGPSAPRTGEALSGPGPAGTPGAWQATAPTPQPTPPPYDALAPRRAGRPPFARSASAIRARIDAEAKRLEQARAALTAFYTGRPSRAPAAPAAPPPPEPLPYDLGHGLEASSRAAAGSGPGARLRLRLPSLRRGDARGGPTGPGGRVRASGTSWAAALVLAFAVGLWAGGAAFSQPSSASTASPGGTAPAPVRIIRSVPTTAKAVALTFDDGPSPKYTPPILQLLQQYGAHATFFVIGQEVERYPQVLKQEVDAGDEIGNHGYHHLTLQNVPADQLISEVRTAEQTLVSLTGSRPTLYRLPGGRSDPAALRQLTDMGYRIIMWTVDTRDYVYRPPAAIVAQVQRQVSPGAILIFHDGGGNQQHTVDALRTLLPWLKEQGYQMMTVSQLLEMPRASVTR